MLENKLGETTVNGSGLEVVHVERLCGDECNPVLREKLIPREELEFLGRFLSNRGITKNFTTGTYDVIHVGHVRYLQIAANLGDPRAVKYLMVGLNSDTSVKKYKGPERPILNEMVRAEMLATLGFIRYITIYDETSGAEVINLFKPDNYLCVEGSWTGDLEEKEEVRAIAKTGGRVYVSPRQDPELSTSAIIQKIASSSEAKKIIQGLRHGMTP